MASNPTNSNKIPTEPLDKGGGVSFEARKWAEGGNSFQSVVSFRDKVLGLQSVPQREKVDLVEKNLVVINLVNGNRLLPMLTVDQKVVEESSLPWRDALTIKRPGKPIGFNIMKTKLTSIWKLMGGFENMDIGNGYFIAKFEHEEDRNKVINGGPWIIFDHYLSVRTWATDFNAGMTTIDRTIVWARIPSLNLIWYDESFLWSLTSAIGKPVKVDLHILRVARGKFARICVEVDLNQPVVRRVGVQ